MVDKTFWESVKKEWMMEVRFEMDDIRPLAEDELDFDELDFDEAFQTMMAGSVISKDNTKTQEFVTDIPENNIEPARPRLEIEAFENYMSQATMTSFIEAGKLLLKCLLPKEMEGLCQELLVRMKALDETVIKFADVYRTDMDSFMEIYIPDTFELIASYLEYLDAGIDADIIADTEAEVMDTLDKLLLALNEKIEEVHKFATIEIRAQAKAIDAMMSQGGFVRAEHRL